MDGIGSFIVSPRWEVHTHRSCVEKMKGEGREGSTHLKSVLVCFIVIATGGEMAVPVCFIVFDTIIFSSFLPFFRKMHPVQKTSLQFFNFSTDAQKMAEMGLPRETGERKKKKQKTCCGIGLLIKTKIKPMHNPLSAQKKRKRPNHPFEIFKFPSSDHN